MYQTLNDPYGPTTLPTSNYNINFSIANTLSPICGESYDWYRDFERDQSAYQRKLNLQAFLASMEVPQSPLPKMAMKARHGHSLAPRRPGYRDPRGR